MMNKSPLVPIIVLVLLISTTSVLTIIAQGTIEGAITAIDSEKKTITVDETVLNVTDKTAIKIDETTATFKDLKVGATYNYDPATLNAILIGATKWLPKIEVIAPNGGEILSDIIIVQINATDPAWDIVNLEWLISSDNGTTWVSLYNDTSNGSPYLYDLNTTQFQNGDEYLIKGIATNEIGITVEDVSNETFEIKN
jgi:hypothetical protein